MTYIVSKLTRRMSLPLNYMLLILTERYGFLDKVFCKKERKKVLFYFLIVIFKLSAGPTQ